MIVKFVKNKNIFQKKSVVKKVIIILIIFVNRFKYLYVYNMNKENVWNVKKIILLIRMVIVNKIKMAVRFKKF